MKFSRKEVFEMVDALFHKYASTYRAEAREELADMIQNREEKGKDAVPNMEKVVVCDKCLRAGCWRGVFMCEDSKTAGSTEMFIDDLKRLNLEHPYHWGSEESGE